MPSNRTIADAQDSVSQLVSVDNVWKHRGHQRAAEGKCELAKNENRYLER